MKISIFGLGYVGAVTAGCLAARGHRVVGADVQKGKVEAFNLGLSPIVEPELAELLAAAMTKGLISATTDAAQAVRESEVSIVCVGTPALESGRLNLDFVRKVSQELRDAISAKGTRHLVIYRSTMLPGSTRGLAKEFFAELMQSGLVEVYYCPEFLREGTAVADFREPSLAALGLSEVAHELCEVVERLLGSGAERMSWESAELLKYSCNYFHALKVGFANEIGRMAKFVGVDGAQVMASLCKDTRLNISEHYLRPGNPFGGSCLPKDVSALSALARIEGVNLPLLDHVLRSNEAHLEGLIKQITSKGARRIGLLGLAFKPDTDDLRGSPMVAVAETLLGRGFQLSVYDPSLQLSRLVGANEADIQRRMPHLATLLRDSAEAVVNESDVIVVAQRCVSLETLAEVTRSEQFVVDVNGWRELQSLAWRYEGLCW